MTDRDGRESIRAEIYSAVKSKLDWYVNLTDTNKWEVVNDAVALYCDLDDTTLIDKRIAELEAKVERLEAQIETIETKIEELRELKDDVESHKEDYDDAIDDVVDYFETEQPRAQIITDNVNIEEIARQYGESPSTVVADVYQRGDFSADRVPDEIDSSDSDTAQDSAQTTDSDSRFNLDTDDDIETEVTL